MTSTSKGVIPLQNYDIFCAIWCGLVTFTILNYDKTFCLFSCLFSWYFSLICRKQDKIYQKWQAVIVSHRTVRPSSINTISEIAAYIWPPATVEDQIQLTQRTQKLPFFITMAHSTYHECGYVIEYTAILHESAVDCNSLLYTAHITNGASLQRVDDTVNINAELKALYSTMPRYF